MNEIWGVSVEHEIAQDNDVNCVSGMTEEEARAVASQDALDDVYMYVAAKKIPHAMDAVVELIDGLLTDNLFSVCDAILESVDLQLLPSNVRSAFLMASKPAKHELHNREGFFQASLAILAKERGAAIAERMLAHLL